MSDQVIDIAVENFPPFQTQVVDAMSATGADVAKLTSDYLSLEARLGQENATLRSELNTIDAEWQGRYDLMVSGYTQDLSDAHEAYETLLQQNNAAFGAELDLIIGEVI